MQIQALSLFLLDSEVSLVKKSLESVKTPWCTQSPGPFTATCCFSTLYSGVLQLIMNGCISEANCGKQLNILIPFNQ